MNDETYKITIETDSVLINSGCMCAYADNKSVGEFVYLYTRTVYAVPYWLLHFCDCKRILESIIYSRYTVSIMCFIIVLCCMDIDFS